MKHSAKVDGRPAFQFYPRDWMSDGGLRLCSLAARGLWMDMLCMMFDSPERGVLRKQNQSKIEKQNLSKMVGATEAEVEGLLAELESNGVFSKSLDGAIYSRRMVKDEHLRLVRSAAGALGGRPSAKAKRKQKTKAKITPSSSSSSSSLSSSTENNNDSCAESPANAGAPAPEPAHAVPEELKGLALYEADPKLCFNLPQIIPNWRGCFPGIDVLTEIRKAHAWEVANPAKRKTPRGRMRFLNAWMDRAQNNGGSHDNGAGTIRGRASAGRGFAAATDDAGKFEGR